MLLKQDAVDYIFVADIIGLSAVFNHLDVFGSQSYRIRWNNAK